MSLDKFNKQNIKSRKLPHIPVLVKVSTTAISAKIFFENYLPKKKKPKKSKFKQDLTDTIKQNEI